MKKKFIYLSLVILSVIAIVVYGCSSKSGVQPVVPVATANTVSIKNFAFAPAVLTVKTGTTVTWTNVDSRTAHSYRFKWHF